jgi:hypothetical protein
MPRFSQMFFYEFEEWEVTKGLGQSKNGSVVSRRGAGAYVRSGVRLESSCGISDVWYRYVELNAGRFKGQNSTSMEFSIHSPVHPSLEVREMEAAGKLFGWDRMHSRPRPTKKGRVLEKSTPEIEDCGKKQTKPGDTAATVSSNLADIARGEEGRLPEETVRGEFIGVDCELIICLE